MALYLAGSRARALNAGRDLMTSQYESDVTAALHLRVIALQAQQMFITDDTYGDAQGRW